MSKPKVKSIKKYALSSDKGNEIDYDKFIRLTEADEFAQQKSLSVQQVKDILNDLEPDKELDKLDDMDDIVEYLDEKGIIKKGNTYNQSFWGNAIEYGVGMGGSDGEQLIFLSMHLGGDVRGNYTKWKAYKYDNMEDVPFYQWNLIVEIDTNKGDIRLQSEGDEAYHFIVERDETGTWKEGEGIKHPDLAEKLDMNKKDIWMAKGGAIQSSDFSSYYARHGAIIWGGYFTEMACGGYMAGGGRIGERYKMGEDTIYVGKSFGVKGYEDNIFLYYEKDDSFIKSLSKNSFDSFVKKGTLKPIMAIGGGVSRDGDRHKYYVKAWKKYSMSYISKKPDYENKKSMNYDEASKLQDELEKKYKVVGIYAKKDDREVSVSLEGMAKGGEADGGYSLGGVLLGAGLGIAGFIGYQKLKEEGGGKSHLPMEADKLKEHQNRLEDKWDKLRKGHLPSKIRFYDDFPKGAEKYGTEYRVWEKFVDGEWYKISREEFDDLVTIPTEREGDTSMYNRKSKSEGGKYVWHLTKK